jgi:hypothetical protein
VVFPHFHGHTAHLYKTEFRYGRYRWKCFPEFGGNSYWGAWQVNANDFAGGVSSPKLSKSPDARCCAPYEGGTTFIKDTSSACEYTKGVSISGSIGIDLSSHTGYDSQASLAYVIGKKGRDICGLNGQAAGNSPPPRLIVAGSP